MVAPVAVHRLIERVQALSHRGETDAAVEVFRKLHPADSSEVLYRIEADARHAILQELPLEEFADVLEELDEEETVEVVQRLTVTELADVLDEMEPDMAADLIGELDEETAAELLGEMATGEGVAPLLDYPQDSAGGIMNSPRHMLHRDMSVGQAMQFLREHYDDAHDLYYLYVLEGGLPSDPEASPRSKSEQDRLVGIVSLRSLVLADTEAKLEEIMDREVVTATAETDQEEVARILARYNLLAVPIIDE